eukprot:TRINITY_DN1522_c0_g1_i2.p1 TRINITY_DN1522_c0_g1~~TRINITY_DN1522_c0_g1_i2.p1  ORF type:complete len:251 (+),score=37.06 TRINITY_DN1522_c0_g1_i2:160-912(+)
MSSNNLSVVNKLSKFSKTRILVIGDSAVGKSSLVHRLCHNKELKDPRWTIGCNIEVMINQSSDDEQFIEFWDVGGRKSYSCSRGVYYHEVNGVLIVHDLTNYKSYQNLRVWVDELVKRDSEESITGHCDMTNFQSPLSRYYVKPRKGQLGSLPVLVIGNKLDDCRKVPEYNSQKDYHLPSLNVSAKTGEGDFDKLRSFIHQINNINKMKKQSLKVSTKDSHLPSGRVPVRSRVLQSPIGSKSIDFFMQEV